LHLVQRRNGSAGRWGEIKRAPATSNRVINGDKDTGDRPREKRWGAWAEKDTLPKSESHGGNNLAAQPSQGSGLDASAKKTEPGGGVGLGGGRKQNRRVLEKQNAHGRENPVVKRRTKRWRYNLKTTPPHRKEEKKKKENRERKKAA